MAPRPRASPPPDKMVPPVLTTGDVVRAYLAPVNWRGNSPHYREKRVSVRGISATSASRNACLRRRAGSLPPTCLNAELPHRAHEGITAGKSSCLIGMGGGGPGAGERGPASFSNL